MTSTTRDRTPSEIHRDRQADRAAMHRLFLISYPLCLIAATSRRITGRFDDRQRRPDQSVFAEARSSAYAAVGYAFHG
jgi:hypothetical protein